MKYVAIIKHCLLVWIQTTKAHFAPIPFFDKKNNSAMLYSIQRFPTYLIEIPDTPNMKIDRYIDRQTDK